MAETQSTTVAEPARQSPSHAPAAVQQPPEKVASPGVMQRATNAISSGSPSTPPNSFGNVIQRMPDPASQVNALNQLQASYGNTYAGQVIQRKCECGDTCDKCAGNKAAKEMDKKLQRKPDGNSSQPVGLAPSIPGGSGGRALSPGTRSQMESHFGEDFGDVRVHTDSEAAESARGLGAQAFTSGRDIYFGEGRAPGETPEGKKLLAHELAHVVQQRNGAVAPGATKLVLDTPGDAFEREADSAAEAVMSGQAVRVGSSCNSPGVQRATCPIFKVPDEKGTYAQINTLYAAQRDGPGLRLRSGVRQTSTDTLRRRWLEKKGHGGELQQLKDDKEFPKDNEGRNCTVDHIVEWILHGANPGKSEEASNMMLMAGRRNKGAGGRVLGQINKMPGNCKSFSDFDDTAKDPPDECMKIDLYFDEWLKNKQGDTTKDTTFILKFKKSEIPFDLSKAAETKNPTGGTVYTISSQLILRARKQVKGEETKAIIFDQITLNFDKNDAFKDGTIDARISDKIAFPFVGPVTKCQLDIDKTQKATLANTAYKGKFPGLSETTFNFKTNDEGSVEGEARLVPSKPILNKTVVHLVVKDDKLSAKLQVPVKDLSLPVPGLTLSGDGLIIGFEDGELFASGQVILQYGNVAKGEFTASATKKGFSAQGKIELTIPGIDQATGKVWIDTEGKLGGEIEVGASKLKVPGVKKANLNIKIEDGALSGEGIVQLAIPGVKQGKLSFGVDKEGNYAITGAATLDVPGLKSAEIGLTYRQGDLEGFAKVGLDIPGLEDAAFEIRYAKGVVTGTGDLAYKKGRLSGKVHAELNEKRKLFGNGELAYQIIPGLVAAVSVELREDGTTKISGELRIPDSINLFDEKSIEKTLFSIGTQIPIIAIPIGSRSVGLVAEVGADLKARAGIGPGQIRQLKVMASFDPAKEDAAFEFSGGGELYVPAFAELALSVHGGIGLSIAIASATGGIELTGALGLRGALSAMVQIAYKDNKFGVDALAEVFAEPVIKFDISAYVNVEVDLLLTTIDVYNEKWSLASKEWGSGLKIGLRFPVHYVFGEPFDVSLSQVEFIVPDIDAKKAVKDLLFS